MLWMGSLRARFFLSGCMVVLATVASAVFGGAMFTFLGNVVDETLAGTQEVIDVTAGLALALEREDDALLLALAGRESEARAALREERHAFDELYERMLVILPHTEADGGEVARSLKDNTRRYRIHGDTLIGMAGDAEAQSYYHEVVNPSLRLAVSDCALLRESGFRAMSDAGITARDGSRRGTWILALVAVAALVLTMVVALYLARTVVQPISMMTESVDALREGDFERRIPDFGDDEIGRLASGFNRMAEGLLAFRRTNLEEVLRAKETLEATLKALPDGVIVFREDGVIESMNPEASRALGQNVSGGQRSVEDLELPEAVRESVRLSLAGEQVEQGADLTRAVSLGADGGMFLPLVAPIPQMPAGKPGTILVLHDVTEIWRLDELRTELIGITSHELKTPLTTLRMNLLLLSEKAESLTERQRDILATAAQGCKELTNTVDMLLDLSRIEAGQLRLSRERIDMRGVVHQVLEPLRGRFDEVGIELALVGMETPVFVRGDANRLCIVLSNLITNALKYTPTGGNVTVRLASQGGFAELTVSDTGRGIAPEWRHRVFEKFFRVEHQTPQRSETTHGAGIGLYLCRQIVDSHGGSIHCEPTLEGGATFRVLLPAIPPSK